jgi:uncharacterized damage-inducible protein DinB
LEVNMPRGTGAGLVLALLAAPLLAQDPATFDQDYLREVGYAARNLTALAEAMPADRYAWRPREGVRSVSEVYLHVAVGNFLLLDCIGQAPPKEVYGELPAAGPERMQAMLVRNRGLEKSVTEKTRVTELLRQSTDAVQAALEGGAAADLEKRVDFFGTERTVRAVLLRMLVHMHEHMGQSVAYARVNGIVPPWSRPRARR